VSSLRHSALPLTARQAQTAEADVPLSALDVLCLHTQPRWLPRSLFHVVETIRPDQPSTTASTGKPRTQARTRRWSFDGTSVPHCWWVSGMVSLSNRLDPLESDGSGEVRRPRRGCRGQRSGVSRSVGPPAFHPPSCGPLPAVPAVRSTTRRAAFAPPRSEAGVPNETSGPHLLAVAVADEASSRLKAFTTAVGVAATDSRAPLTLKQDARAELAGAAADVRLLQAVGHAAVLRRVAERVLSMRYRSQGDLHRPACGLPVCQSAPTAPRRAPERRRQRTHRDGAAPDKGTTPGVRSAVHAALSPVGPSRTAKDCASRHSCTRMQQ
jgi:hypothetical protein